MTFAAPEFLWTLFGAIPIIALHLIRWKRRTIVVSTLRFWEEGRGPESRQLWLSRLREASSLALYLAMLTLLALGLAEIRIPGLTHDSEEILLVLDDSPSMFAEARMARAHARMREFWRYAPARNDWLTVATTSGRVLGTFEAIEGTPSLPVTVSFPGVPADQWTAPWGELRDFDRRILVTDGSDAGVPTADSWSVEVVGVEARNAGIIGFEIAADRVIVRVKNYSMQPLDLSVDGTTKRVEPGSSEAFDLGIPAGGADVISFSLLPEDDFPLDQTVFVPIQRAEAPSIVVVTPGKINPFLWQALELLSAEGSIDSKRLYHSPSFPLTWDRGIFGIFDHCDPPETLAAGRYLFIPCGKGVAPIRVGGEVEGLKPVWVSSDLEGTGSFHLRRGRVFESIQGQETLIESDRGPIAVRGREGGTVYAALGFKLADSDIQLTPLFPMLVRRSLAWLRESRLFPREIRAGQTWRNRYPLGTESIQVSGVRTAAPGGWVSIPSGGPGVLSARSVDFDESAAVNLFDDAESDLRIKVRGGGPAWPQSKWWWGWPSLSFACLVVLVIALIDALFWSGGGGVSGPH